jgi:hypothetical protein
MAWLCDMRAPLRSSLENVCALLAVCVDAGQALRKALLVIDVTFLLAAVDGGRLKD